jgi:hypothetical protein
VTVSAFPLHIRRLHQGDVVMGVAVAEEDGRYSWFVKNHLQATDVLVEVQ